MNISDNIHNHTNSDRFASLKKSIDKQRKIALKKRIAQKPQVMDIEYLLGAFLEMYEPHLKEIVHILFRKGYVIDASSGFGGENAQFQALTGDVSVDYVTRNKLEKYGVKFREYNGSKSLIFWPEKATIENINEKWLKITEALPDKKRPPAPSTSQKAIMFRRKYIPQDKDFRKQRLFEKLKFNILNKVYLETKKRQNRNIKPNKIELKLGLFIQELEPQVRKAVTEMNNKGYSTDKSGFMDNPCDQMIEGDFQLDENTMKKIEESGACVETNPSGYTRIKFAPLEPDIGKVRKQWNKIIALLPNNHKQATVSMTKKARDFRLKYQYNSV